MFNFLRRQRTETASPPQPALGPGVATAGSAPSATAEQWLQRLEWTVLKRLDGQLQGDYRSLFRGAGLVLADLREYQAHDDVRHIDWNVTARMQTPYVREHQEDREVAAWFVVDVSGSVAFGSGTTSKHQRACEVLLNLPRPRSRCPSSSRVWSKLLPARTARTARPRTISSSLASTMPRPAPMVLARPASRKE